MKLTKIELKELIKETVLKEYFGALPNLIIDIQTTSGEELGKEHTAKIVALFRQFGGGMTLTINGEKINDLLY